MDRTEFTPRIWDTQYEIKAVTLLTVAWSLVGLDRYVINSLFPTIAKDLGLSYGAIGTVAGSLAVTWAIFALLCGGLSDKVGRRKVLIPGLIGFSLFSALSGLATGFLMLAAIRAFIGALEGACAPVTVAHGNEVSKPERRGRNLGIILGSFNLTGLALAPIIATQLLRITSWREVFFLSGIPGLIVAFLLYKVMREPNYNSTADRAEVAESHQQRVSYRDIFRYRNIILGLIGMFGTFGAMLTLATFIPSYLTDYIGVSEQRMGIIASGLGFGGFIGSVIVLTVSDKVGRKIALSGFYAIGIIALLIFSQEKGNASFLFFLVLLAGFCVIGCSTLLVGPVPTESVPPTLMASAAGIFVAAGELVGSGLTPVIGGLVAQNYGIQNIIWVTLGALILAFVATLFLKETAPSRVRRTLEREEQEQVGM